MNMEIDKDKFRNLISDGKVPQALQRLGDIGHFLNNDQLKEDIVRLTTKYRALNPVAGQTDEEIENLKIELLDLIENLPEDFEPDAGSGSGKKGCMGLFLGLFA